MVVKDIEKFKALCKPVVDYIAENGDPYTEVHISMDKIYVTSVECGIPLIPEYYECERGADGKLKNILKFHSEPIEPGYNEIKSILSDQVVIRFSVPCHGWNELAMSKEWKDFQDLLEKYQTG